MSDLQTENSKKLFNLTKLAETPEAKADAGNDGAEDTMRLKKFFRPTILNLSDMQEASPTAV